jgi:hypothetical protein
MKKEKDMKRRLMSRLLLAVLAAPILAGCSTAKVTGKTSFPTEPITRPAMIYVADFELQAARIQEESGLLPKPDLPDPIRRILPHQTDDPNEMAVNLVNLMSDSIVMDLAKAGYSATKLAPGQQMPSDGWLVRGVFTGVQEGNKLRRVVIGFGAGKTDLQVVTSVDRLGAGSPLKPLYEVQTDATSGNAPGSAAMIVLNPAAGGASRWFVSSWPGKISTRM